MKKIIFLALVALLGIHTVDAQRRGGTRTPEQIVEKLDKKLNLTDEQVRGEKRNVSICGRPEND